MLLNFTVENCLSFKNEQEFTLLRKGKHSTQNGQDAQTKISPIAVIYGDNAAGKSNLLKCMNFFSNFVRNSFAPREGINTQPFCWTTKAQNSHRRSISNSLPKMKTATNTGSVSMLKRCGRKCYGCSVPKLIGAL